MPSTPVGSYVYCTEVKKWVIHAEPRSSPSSVGTGQGDKERWTDVSHQEENEQGEDENKSALGPEAVVLSTWV